jgi:histone H3
MPVHASVAQRLGGKQIAGKQITGIGKSVGGKQIAGKQIAGKQIAGKQIAGKNLGGKSIAKKNVNPLLAGKQVARKNPKAAAYAAGGVPKPHRKRPGTAAIIEMKELQGITKQGKHATKLLLRKLPFGRLVRDIANEQDGVDRFAPEGLRWTTDAIAAVQEAAENYITGLFSDTVLETIHGRRVTTYVKDMKLARRVRGEIA